IWRAHGDRIQRPQLRLSDRQRRHVLLREPAEGIVRGDDGVSRHALRVPARHPGIRRHGARRRHGAVRGRGRAMSWKHLLLVSAAIACVFSASTAHAAPSCTVSTTSVNFGSYNVFTGSATDSTGTVTVDCNVSAHNIVVTLSRGASSSYNPRTMLKGSEALSYNLYRDA